MDEGYVLVIGSSGIDVKGRPDSELTWFAPNLGRARNSVGGVARNIAENLSRLEISVVLLTAVGDDFEGRRVIEKTALAGVNCNYIRHIPDAFTGVYMALLKPDGDLHVAISDFEIMQHVDSDYVMEHEDLLKYASMVVIDSTLSEETLDTVFELAQRHNVRVAADPTTPALASRLCKYINQLHLVVPNAGETTALCGLQNPARDRESAIDAARHLVTLGAKIAVVTMGEVGVAYADSNGGGFIRAVKTDMVDATGAGDAFTSAVIFGLLNEVPVDEAMRLGATAAALTLHSRETVLPNLSQEILYDELVI